MFSKKLVATDFNQNWAEMNLIRSHPEIDMKRWNKNRRNKRNVHKKAVPVYRNGLKYCF
jgi:hypothetical protein